MIPENNPSISERGKGTSENSISIEQAEQILGPSHVLGAKALEKTWDIKIQPSDIPVIPFSQIELQEAKRKNQFLILRIRYDGNGQPLSIVRMKQLLQSRFRAEGKGEIERDLGVSINQYESFYNDDTAVDNPDPNVSMEWALITSEILPTTIDKNYAEQTCALALYAHREIVPTLSGNAQQKYLDAIAEIYDPKSFDPKIPDDQQRLMLTPDFSTISQEIAGMWPEAASKLRFLRINTLLRPSATQSLYDMIVVFDNTGQRLFEDKIIWTKSATMAQDFVVVRSMSESGSAITPFPLRSTGDDLGVYSSRTI